MKYNQPLDQENNPDGSYTDGNPAAGVNGSIIPAAAVEFPQREIVNYIKYTGLEPDDANLTQLTEATQLVDVCNVLKKAVNTGTANSWGATIPGLPLGLSIATAFWFAPKFESLEGGVTIMFNGGGPYEVRYIDRTPIGKGDISQWAWVMLFFDGTYFLVVIGGRLNVKATETEPGGPEYLQAPKDFYVNDSIGNDAYDGLTPDVGAGHGPFKTIQKALNQIPKYNLNGYDIRIHVADGTYQTQGTTSGGEVNGAGAVRLIGNVAAPQNVLVHSIAGSALILSGKSVYSVDGFTFWAPVGGDAGNGTGLAALSYAVVVVGHVRFKACGTAHLSSGGFAHMYLIGCTITIEASANTSYCLFVASQGAMDIDDAGLVVLGPVNITWFVGVTTGSLVGGYFHNGIVQGAYVAGYRYVVGANGMIDTNGGGANAFPGTLAGSVGTGGVYIN